MRKGISLVALVVTIIVLIILTGAIVLTAFNNGILDRSEEAVFKSNMQSFQEELTMYIMNKKAEFAYSEVNVIYNDNEDEHYNNMKEYINSFSKKYASKVQIVKDKIEYIGTDDQEKQWVSGLGITVNSIEVVGDISDWELSNETDSLRIIGYKGSKTKDVEIPNVLVIDGEKKEVTNINLTSSTNNLTGTLTVPSNVFLGNVDLNILQNINKLIIKDNVKINFSISWASFTGNLEEVVIGNNCTIQQAFIDAPANTIGNITIGNNSVIEVAAFSDANINGNITIGSNATIGICAFGPCNINGSVTIGDGSILEQDVFIVNNEFTGIKGKVKIGNNVTVGSMAFLNNKNINSVEIGENVTLLGSAFASCIGIKSVKIPGSTILGVGDFYRCTALNNVEIGTGITTIGKDAFDGCTLLTEIRVGHQDVVDVVKGSGYTGNVVVDTSIG